MPEYIEREKALQLLNKNSITKKITLADGVSIYNTIEKIPTADVVEVRHSEWKQVTFSDGTKSCKCCMACGTFVEPQYNYKYCPECGAKMDGKGGCDEID